MTEHDETTNTDAVVDVRDLRVHFPVRRGVLGAVSDYVKAVDGVTFSVARAEIVALVGESGCGKTTTAQAIAGLLRATSGRISLAFDSLPQHTVDWDGADRASRKAVRRRMQMIFQGPYSSLDPRQTVRAILEEPLIIHSIGSPKERLPRIQELLESVGLSNEYLERYPHEFSGGQRQRIGIARALATDPELIIADEPVSALDVSIQAQIINLLLDLKTRRKQTQLFISHDLAVVRHMADRIAVMYQGKIVESGSEAALFGSPRHPYTLLLLDSVPVPGKGRKKHDPATVAEDAGMPGATEGCSFYPRCPRRRDECRKSVPPLTAGAAGATAAACFNPVS